MCIRDRYEIFVDTGKGFEEKGSVSASDSVYSMDYKQLMFDVTGSKVCFYVTTSELSNPYGLQGESKSSEICSSPVEIITVPNVFTPNNDCLLYTSPSPRDGLLSRMPSS